MSKHKEVSPTLVSQGIIDFNLHYGPFAHHWWHEISTENGSEFYPICLGMTILTELNSMGWHDPKTFAISVPHGKFQNIAIFSENSNSGITRENNDGMIGYLMA
ncbi:15143_t:CDS:2 [Entrophospora sp. SA101]|nr:15143_t:CDS:2 [Entrophospora sp. SA101]